MKQIGCLSDDAKCCL